MSYNIQDLTSIMCHSSYMAHIYLEDRGSMFPRNVVTLQKSIELALADIRTLNLIQVPLCTLVSLQ
jgi:hypothetical protein